MSISDTIFAPASGKGRAAIAVLRVSGSRAGDTLRIIAGAPLPSPRSAALRRLINPGDDETLDRALVLWFPGPGSYTGEDMAEFHIHGGRAVLDGMLDVLGRLAGLRPAEPGEFTERAFRNGHLDLTAAEAVADLIDAETAAQRRQALGQLEGGLSRLYERWRADLTTAMGYAEATIDFSDQPVPVTVAEEAALKIKSTLEEISQHLADDHRGERLRDGFRIAILGAPNVGKSSLLNRLARRDAAIVADTAGTTRDVIEVHLDLGGYPVIIADTAGLREAVDDIESEGVRRALARAGAADLKIALFDATNLGDPDQDTLYIVEESTLLVANKQDLVKGPLRDTLDGRPIRSISCETGEGLDGLVADLAAHVAGALDRDGEALSLTRARHRHALGDCRAALERYLTTSALVSGNPELGAEDLRLADRALGRITGRVDVEDILDVVFRHFCIGK